MAYRHNLADILEIMGYTPYVDFVIVDNLDGGSPSNNPQITEWKAGLPIPTEQDVEDAWNTYLGSASRLDELKANARNLIDISAEKARHRYITGGDGQAMTYLEKGNEAADYIAAGYPIMGSPPEYPFVHADSVAFGIIHQEAADQIVAQKSTWVAVGAQIEQERLNGKNTVTNATDESEINTARDNTITALEAI